MLKKRRYCLLCCVDLDKQRRFPSNYPYEYTLVGLVEVFCKHFDCTPQSLFGGPDPDFIKEPFPFCIDCKLLMVNIYGLEESIKASHLSIGSSVRQLLTRCLTCRKRNCPSCQIPQHNPRVPTVTVASDSTEDGISTALQTVETEPSSDLCRSKSPLGFRQKLLSRFRPQVTVEKQFLEQLAERHGLKIYEPIPVAPNVFVDLEEIQDEPVPETNFLESTLNPTDVNIRSLEAESSVEYAMPVAQTKAELAVVPKQDSSEVPNSLTNLRTLTSEDQETLIQSNQNQHNEEETPTIIVLIQETELCTKQAQSDSSMPHTKTDDPCSISESIRPVTRSHPTSTVTVTEEVVEHKPSSSRNDVLGNESPEAFKKLFKFLDVQDKDKNTQRLSVQTVKNDTFLLENQWSFAFKEGEGYSCGACDRTATTAEEFVTHCKDDHPELKCTLTDVKSKLWNQFARYRRRVQNAIEANDNWRETFHDIAKNSDKFSKAFDLMTKPLGDNEFIYDTELKFHLTKSNFHCGACDFTEPWKSVFINHLFEEHASNDALGKQIRLGTCPMEEVTPNKFVYRNLTCQKIQDDYTCDTCEFKTTDKSRMQRHLYVRHFMRNRYVCTTCGKVFRSNITLVTHCRGHKTNDPSSTRKYLPMERFVEIEPNKFTYRGFPVTKIDLDYHCLTCNKYHTPSKRYIQHHLYHRHFAKKPKKQVTKDIICEECGRTFTNPNTFYSHTQWHLARKNPGHFVCETCGKVMTNSVSFYTHQRRHREKKISCQVCGKMFLLQSQLAHHSAKHSDDKKWPCLECNKSYKNRESLTLHKKTHGGNRPYSCDICGKTFTQSYSVTKHKMVLHPDQKESDVVDQ